MDTMLAGLHRGRDQAGSSYHVELFKPGHDLTIAQELLDPVAKLLTVLAAVRPTSDRFAAFRESFSNRYEAQEMPLLDVLSDETGIGFDVDNVDTDEIVVPFLRGLPRSRPASTPVQLHEFDAFLMNKLREAAESDRDILKLKLSDVAVFAKHEPRTSSTMIAHLALGEARADAPTGDKHFVCFWGASGPSDSYLFGRFAHGDDDLRAHLERVRDTTRVHADVHEAEVVHVPQPRMGNVIARPTLSAYEITILARSSVAPDHHIPVRDLLVSVVEGRVRLRSKRLGIEVSPRLSSAHAFQYSDLAVYRFLCELQNQHAPRWVGWSWGPLSSMTFLPRVEIDSIVVSRARWQLDATELVAAGGPSGYVSKEYRTRHRLSDVLCLVEGDRKLYVDFRQRVYHDMLLSYVRNKRTVTLEEVFPRPDQAAVHSPEGFFSHELQIPVTYEAASSVKAIAVTATHQVPNEARYFPPGSEWLYAKIYADITSADALITESLWPCVEACKGWVRGWFFIKYRDPNFHIRLRVNGPPDRLLSELLPLLSDTFRREFDEGIAHAFTLETYQREIERYGGPRAMEVAERQFRIDSESFVAARKVCGPSPSTEMFYAAICGVDAILHGLGFDIAGRRTFAERRRLELSAGLGTDNKGFRDATAKNFRADSTLRSARFDVPDSFRSEACRAVLSTVPVIARQVRVPLSAILNLPDNDLARAEPLAALFIHMHVNRFTSGNGVLQELVIYDYLTKVYSRMMHTSVATSSDDNGANANGNDVFLRA